MKSFPTTSALVWIFSFALSRALLAQGPLTPPGAPAPTMKTLDQIESRTPISSLPYIVAAGGSYYLTANLNVASGDGITINTDNVSLDLNGYTISSTEGTPTGTGILISGIKKNIRIRDGSIRGNVDNFGNFMGTGFAYGIRTTFGLFSVRVDNISVLGCLVDGINVGGASIVVENCTVRSVGGRGISAETVLNCSATNCTTEGINGRTVMNSSGEALTGTGLYAETAENCHGLVGNSGNSSSIGLSAVNALNCYGSVNNAGKGLDAQHAQNSHGISQFGTGLNATTADGCSGISYTSGTGLQANVANNSQGESASGIGLIASRTAQNCTGSSSGEGLIAARSAQNCSGASSGAGTGVDAPVATNCHGTSATGRGINAQVAQNCYGTSGGAATAVEALNATNCYGHSNTGTGLKAFVAQNCLGRSLNGGISAVGLDASQATNCYGANSGPVGSIGLKAFIAVGCHGAGNPFMQTSHRYLSSLGLGP